MGTCLYAMVERSQFADGSSWFEVLQVSFYKDYALMAALDGKTTCGIPPNPDPHLRRMHADGGEWDCAFTREWMTAEDFLALRLYPRDAECYRPTPQHRGLVAFLQEVTRDPSEKYRITFWRS